MITPTILDGNAKLVDEDTIKVIKGIEDSQAQDTEDLNEEMELFFD